MRPSRFNPISLEGLIWGLVVVVFGVFSPSPLYAGGDSAPLEKGLYWFGKRAEISSGKVKANTEALNRAIKFLEKAHEENPSETTAYHLLNAYHVKGIGLSLSQTEKQELFARGKTFGEQMVEEYPNSVRVLYGYASNLGRWAQAYGVIASAREGVADKMRTLCQRMQDIDPTFAYAGPYRMMGIVHIDSPYIPLILTWPSDRKALENLENAKKIAPENPSNVFHYAKALHLLGRTDEALNHLKQVVQRNPRPGHPLEDRRNLKEARKFLERISSEG